MKKLIKKLPSDFKDISTLAFGNGFALVIPVLASPILTRLYSENDFGVLTIYISIVSILSSVATARYDFAILISNTRKNASHLFKSSILISFFVSMVSVLVFYFFSDFIISSFNSPSLKDFLFFIPFNVFLFSSIVALQNSLNREKEYRGISMSKTIRSALVGFSQLIFGFLGLLSGGLIIGKLLGDLFSTGYLTSRLFKVEGYLNQKFDYSRGVYLLKKYDKYLKFNAPHALVTSISTSSTALILSYFFGEEIVGFYGLSFMVCIAPVAVISTAFYPIISQKISEKVNQGLEIRSYTKKSIQVLALISFLPFLGLIIYGPEIFTFVFGEEWAVSGIFVQILAPYLFLVFILSPLMYIPLVVNKHKNSFGFEIVLTVSRVGGMIFGSLNGDVYLALALYVGFSIIVQLANLIWIYSLTKKNSESL